MMEVAQERSAFLWTLPSSAAAREAIAAAVYADGTRKVYVKAGGDGGVLWVPGLPLPVWARPQWSDEWLAPFERRGIACVPWTYNWPTTADQSVCRLALLRKPSDELVLNVETEWRVQSPENPWRSLAEANAATAAWLAALRPTLPSGTRLGFSAVPSWADFPYEAFASACDFALPQHYWPGSLLAGGKDQVVRHLERAGGRIPCVPILTASGEYDLGGVVGLAADAIRECPDLAGFSTWECANAAYQHVAVRQAYALLGDLARRDPLDFAAAVEGATDVDSLLERVLG
jgi:hypothetical protein